MNGTWPETKADPLPGPEQTELPDATSCLHKSAGVDGLEDCRVQK